METDPNGTNLRGMLVKLTGYEDSESAGPATISFLQNHRVWEIFLSVLILPQTFDFNP
jgi:hypothetical protein